MGRTIVFNGQELVIPDAYSALDVSRLLTPTSGGVGIVALVGEADGGAPGLHIFPGGSSSKTIKEELKSGPLANMSRLALRAGDDELVPAGASAVLAYKTNNSTPSSVQAGGLSAGLPRISNILAVADVGGSLDGKWFGLADEDGTVAFWIDETGSTPEPAHGLDRAVKITTIVSGDADTVVAGKLVTAIEADSKFSALIATSPNLRATNDYVGSLVDGVTAGTSGFTVTIFQVGIDVDTIGAIKIESKQYGLFTALYTAEIATVTGKKYLTVRDEEGVPEVSDGVGEKTYLQLVYTGNGSAATATLKYESGFLKLKTTLTGQTDGSVNLDIDVSSLNLLQIKNKVNLYTGYTATVESIDEQILATDLDLFLTGQNIKTTPLSFKASIYELMAWSETKSVLVNVTRGASNEGDQVPGTFVATSLTGGTRGTTSNSLVQAALNELLKLRVNILVPLFSSDNQDGSTVTIAAINSQVKDHVQSRSAILGRSECQAYVSIEGNKDAFKAEAARMGSRWVGVSSQIVSDLDIDGNIADYPEYAFSVVCAQTQAGSPIGTPLTNKIMPISGLSQDVSWNPQENGAELIKAGCLIGGADENNQIRIIAGYTSWLGDDNNANIFVETVESLAVFAFNHRKFMKQRFVGKSSFSSQDVMDAIKQSCESERDDTKSIKGFDLKLVKLTSITAGKIEYDVPVIPWEGVVFVLPTVVAFRE